LFIRRLPPEFSTLSLHDALPIYRRLRPSRRSRGQALVETALVIPMLLLLALGVVGVGRVVQAQLAVSAAAREAARAGALADDSRSEEHTSELQSRFDLVCRLLLE